MTSPPARPALSSAATALGKRTKRLHIYTLVDLPEWVSPLKMSCFLGEKCNYEPMVKESFFKGYWGLPKEWRIFAG